MVVLKGEGKKNTLEFLLPEVQIYECIKKYGFTAGDKVMREGRMYINDEEGAVKNRGRINDNNYFRNALVYVYLFFFSLLSLLIIFSPVYFVADINNLLVSGKLNNTCLTMFYEMGIFAGFAMLVPLFRRIYYLIPWMYYFVVTICFDLIIMGFSVRILSIVENYKILNLTITAAFFVFLRIIMCILFNRYNYCSGKSFKIVGSIIFTIGFMGIIFL